MAAFEGRGKCAHCKRGVDVYSDKNGFAYYKCGPCQTKVMHQGRRESDKVLAGLERDATPEDGPAPTPTPTPAPAPAPIPVKPAVPRVSAPASEVPPAPPASLKKPGGLFANFTL